MSKLFIVVGPNCWGSGPSLRSAVGKARINYPSYRGSSESMPYNAYEASPGLRFDVSPFGDLEWESESGECKKVREVRYDDKGNKSVKEIK